MNTTSYTIDFDSGQAELLGTLEGVLAVARRGGLQLSRLLLEPHPQGATVCLAVSADEPDRLDLFATRVANLIGVTGVRPLLPPNRGQTTFSCEQGSDHFCHSLY